MTNEFHADDDGRDPSGNVRARSAEPLRKYLARADVSCHACGYSLKGMTDVFCPECGVVIPRPPADEARKDRGDVPRRLLCRKCGYTLAELKSAQCPECGESALIALMEGDRPDLKREGWLVRGVPLTLILPALGALPVAAALFVKAFSAPSWSGGKGLQCFIGGCFALVPPIICVLWYACRHRLWEIPASFRRMFAGCAFVVSVSILIGAFVFLVL